MTTLRCAFLIAAGAVLGGCAPAAEPDPMVDPYSACYRAEERVACFRAVEAERLRGARGRVIRDGRVLRITPEGGEPLVLEDDSTEGDEYEVFRYRAFLPQASHHLIEITFYEGTAFLMVSERTGSLTYLPEAPLFSPDATRFASVSMDLEAFYDANVIQVWKVSPEKPELEWELDLDTRPGSSEWGPSDARWIDGRTIELVKNEIDDATREYVRTPMRLQLVEGRWVLEEAR